MAKLKSINEVQALRGVFYKFFDTQAVKGDENARDRVLINMQVAEASINPFHNPKEVANTDQGDDSLYFTDTSIV